MLVKMPRSLCYCYYSIGLSTGTLRQRSVTGMGSSQSADGGNVKELKVVVVGMPNAGAKSLVARWTTDAWLEKPEKNDPGWQPLMRPFDKTQLHLLAVGSTVGLWQEHISTADVLVFVVDGSDEFDEAAFSESFNKAAFALKEGAPVVILVNKVDADPDDDSKEAAMRVADSPGSAVQAKCSAAVASCAVSQSVRQCKALLSSAKSGFGCEEAIRAICGVRLVF
ncbi:unnamed protein product [Durusdinium trenchii]|uniref:Uncharacterized protein n=1 Tax=Durusdinium trenchii TaxID=1381693 RepID=A0ABP0SGJ0_9DINO